MQELPSSTSAATAGATPAMDLADPAFPPEARLALLESTRPPRAQIAALIASEDPATAKAGALCLARRFAEGLDAPGDLAACVPADVTAIPPEAQETIAELAVAGLPVRVPAARPGAPPLLRLAWRRAELLADPAALPLAGEASIDRVAVRDLPVERVVASGLLDRLVASEWPAVHDAALGYLREGLERALVEPQRAQAHLAAIADRSAAAVAAKAVHLLREPWSAGLPCPPIRGWLAREDEVAVPAVQLAGERREPSWLRRAVDDEAASPAVRRAAMAGLGLAGDATDVARVVAASSADPGFFARAAAQALLALKRRGVSADEDEAARMLAMFLDSAELDPAEVAEITSSRADALLPAIDAAIAGGASKGRIVALLEGWTTQRALARLLQLAGDREDREGAHHAILALGRLEERSAEAVVLGRLDDVTDACVEALERIGGGATVDHVRKGIAASAEGARPRWLDRALPLLYGLDPSPEVLALLDARGLLASVRLSAWPAHTGARETDLLARIADAPGHPARDEAIAALGRTGGPLAVDPLARLLTDGDERIRDAGKAALRALGVRLAAQGVRLACLAHGRDPGEAMVAEAAVRRLRARAVREDEAALLLDALAGHAHPHLVRAARPYLRHASPEIRKRAVACLAAAGPPCASWILPSLRDEDPCVARQALIALGTVGAKGVSEPIARWLGAGNMNLKKTAAEALAGAGDAAIVPVLVRWLGRHDNPGFRALLASAVRAVAKSFFPSIVVTALAAAQTPREAALLAEALDGALSAADLAAITACRPSLPAALLLRAYAGEAPLRDGDPQSLDAELARRGLADRIPRAEDEPAASLLRPGLARAACLRRGVRLRALLREAPFAAAPSTDLLDLVRAAADPDLVVVAELSGVEARALAALVAHADGAVAAGLRRLLGVVVDPVALAGIAPHVDLGARAEPEREALLGRVFVRAWPPDARAHADAADAVLRARARAVLRVDAETPVLVSWSETTALLADMVDAGRLDDLLRWLEQPSTPRLPQVAAAVAARLGADAALAFAERWIERAPWDRAQAVLDLGFLGEARHDALCRLVQGDAAVDLRVRALRALGERRGERHRALLRAALDDPHAVLREEAARALLDRGTREDRARVVTAWLEGAFREAFTMPLEREDAPLVARAVARATSEEQALRLLRPVDALSDDARVPLLLDLAVSPHARVSGAARDRLRALPPERVVPFVEPALREGGISLLDVVGARGAVPPALIAAARPEDAAAWTRFARRAAGQGLLHAPGLGERLAAWAADDPAAISALARLTDWCDPERAPALARALEGALSGARRDAVIAAVVDALRDQPPLLRARVLAPLARPSDEAAVRALREAEVEAPGVLQTLPPALRDAVEQALETATGMSGDEETRLLLTYLAERADRPTAREALLSKLERCVADGSRRVRLHAHRLLRTLAPRERYLRATRALLDDADAATVRSAIRSLAFGGDAASAPAIAERLFHPSRAVQQAAREGLVALGEHAVGPLRKALAAARPDRRPAIQAVLDEVEVRPRLDQPPRSP